MVLCGCSLQLLQYWYVCVSKLWMCGGGIEIVPCSRVGHIFRSGRPYSSPGGDTMGRNVIRVAEVWLDDYKEVVYKV